MPEFEIGGGKVSCQIKRRDVRYIYLKVRPGFKLEIVLPRKVDISVDGILEKKRAWIERKIEELSRAQRLFDSDTLLYNGEPLRVKVHQAKKTGQGVRLYKKVILVYEDSGKKKEDILTDFITRQTLDYVQQRARELAPKLGVTYQTVSTKEMRKWGCCTRQGNLSFNWRLICLPQRLTDYVVVHELLHLRHFNHSRRFKRNIARYFKDYREVEAELKSYLIH